MANPKFLIIGAGVAGLYAAWRLLEAKDVTGLDPSDVVIVELSSRTDGRLFTYPLDKFGSDAGSLPKNSGLRAELGGMRFQNYHLYVGYLARRLGLTYVDFPADIPENWHLLRGTALQTSAFPDQHRYELLDEEKHKTPADIVMKALGTIVKTEWLPTPDGKVTLRHLVDSVLSAAPAGVPLCQQGFWNLLIGNGKPEPDTTNISNEAYEFFVDSGAYDTIPSNWNAADAVTAMAVDFAGSPQYYALTNGYESLPATLHDQLVKRQVDIRCGWQATAVRPSGAGYEVTFADPKQGSIVADNVVLALPRRSLELIQLPSGLPALDNQLEQTTPIPLFKIFLVYSTPGDNGPWWQGITGDSWPQFTRMTTDLPMRQIYNFGSYYDASTKSTYTLVQASYSDALRAGYWAGLLSEEDRQAINTSIYGGVSVAKGTATYENGLLIWRDGSDGRVHPLFTTVHDQFVTLLEAVAGQAVAANVPIAGAAMDWAVDPFGGGVNFWNVGADVGKTYGEILYPKPWTVGPAGGTGQGGLFVVGEGYSLLQGWVEGALWTVEDAMRKAYGEDAWNEPSWLSRLPVPPPGTTPVVRFKAPDPEPGAPELYFYTTIPSSAPAGWIRQGVAFYSVDATAQSPNESVGINQYVSVGTPHRYLYATGGDHPGWTLDKTDVFFVPTREAVGAVPVYRYYTKITQFQVWNMFYSLDANVEGWERDGVAFYAFS